MYFEDNLRIIFGLYITNFCDKAMLLIVTLVSRSSISPARELQIASRESTNKRPAKG